MWLTVWRHRRAAWIVLAADAGAQGGTAAFPAPPASPADNPTSEAKVELGHALFMDKRLSVDGSRSCYSCHQNELGNADGRPKALGAGNKPLPRNTPTIWNVGYRKQLYWDGRAGSLEAQATGAWGGGNMGVGPDNLAAHAKKIGDLPEYRKRFEKIFGVAPGAPVTPDHVVKAISAYERTLTCSDTAYDREAFDTASRRGRVLFDGKAGCVTCHLGPELTDDLYHAVGAGYTDGAREPDVGRGKVTSQHGDQYRFRTPGRRNVARSAP